MALLERFGKSGLSNQVPTTETPSSPLPSAAVGRLGFRALLPNGWITGTVASGSRRLSDVLNTLEDGVLFAEEVRVGNRDGPAADHGIINLTNALFIVPIEEGIPGSRDPSARIRKRRERVRLGIGGYTIIGDLHLADNATLRNARLLAQLDFIPLTSAEIQHADNPRDRERQAIIFVNRRRIDYLVPWPGS